MPPTDAPRHQPNPTLFFDTVQGYQRSFALKAAVDLNLFTVIGSGGATAAEAAKGCAASERGLFGQSTELSAPSLAPENRPADGGNCPQG